MAPSVSASTEFRHRILRPRQFLCRGGRVGRDWRAFSGDTPATTAADDERRQQIRVHPPNPRL